MSLQARGPEAVRSFAPLEPVSRKNAQSKDRRRFGGALA
jgi:hypothetical protein